MQRPSAIEHIHDTTSVSLAMGCSPSRRKQVWGSFQVEAPIVETTARLAVRPHLNMRTRSPSKHLIGELAIGRLRDLAQRVFDVLGNCLQALKGGG
eukprot:scaffold79410_cov32-Tisochrysis_lutea.AAC.2